jgi:uncharacterized protein Usg
MKTMTKGGKDWSKKLDGALWAYRTAHKTLIGMTPYQFVYGKNMSFTGSTKAQGLLGNKGDES